MSGGVEREGGRKQKRSNRSTARFFRTLIKVLHVLSLPFILLRFLPLQKERRVFFSQANWHSQSGFPLFLKDRFFSAWSNRGPNNSLRILFGCLTVLDLSNTKRPEEKLRNAWKAFKTLKGLQEKSNIFFEGGTTMSCG